MITPRVLRGRQRARPRQWISRQRRSKWRQIRRSSSRKWIRTTNIWARTDSSPVLLLSEITWPWTLLVTGTEPADHLQQGRRSTAYQATKSSTWFPWWTKNSGAQNCRKWEEVLTETNRGHPRCQTKALRRKYSFLQNSKRQSLQKHTTIKSYDWALTRLQIQSQLWVNLLDNIWRQRRTGA